ncbi:MAG: hypothetical protein MR607_00040 [Lachnospiraceae bacterium]|nr:hypothetical protein [Lachnospiraceae bacterium]
MENDQIQPHNEEKSLKVLLMQNLQTAATVLTHRLPHSAKPHARILPNAGYKDDSVQHYIKSGDIFTDSFNRSWMKRIRLTGV